MKEELISIIQDKANKSASLISKVIEVSSDLEPKNVSISIDAMPCLLEDDGSFLVLTGTKQKPYGIGLKNHPLMVLVYNENGGVLIPTSIIREIIKEHRSSLTPEIDSTYSIMGIRLNMGIISSSIGEEILTALHQSSALDS